eukprot:TRINITY_DN4271_c0_g1_i4.p1 TRINITY_DN4271_c0_g1~~TRINITY_DN4271_c0_g1_i4.p1  ORF type:complete len:101 (+),score=19.89 TRINITY_DN4271_c0_g1_i4:70-372(+)
MSSASLSKSAESDSNIKNDGAIALTQEYLSISLHTNHWQPFHYILNLARFESNSFDRDHSVAFHNVLDSLHVIESNSGIIYKAQLCQSFASFFPRLTVQT